MPRGIPKAKKNPEEGDEGATPPPPSPCGGRSARALALSKAVTQADAERQLQGQ